MTRRAVLDGKNSRTTVGHAGKPGAARAARPKASVIHAGISAAAGESDEAVSFGPFVLKPAQRMLLHEGKAVPLGSRSLDILCLLVERAGQIVGKDEILARVWPTTYIADGNLRVHVAGLRKALGDGRDGQRYIVNVPNRGYSFVEAVQRNADEALPQEVRSADVGPAWKSLPALQSQIIGRDQAAQALTEQIVQRRLVTVVGAGGVGKTTLAVSTVTSLLAETRAAAWSGAYFVDLASLADTCLVPSALGSALGVATVADGSLSGLIAHLQDKELLILFDNCEHVIGAVAEIADAILRGAPRVRILATSREPLRIEGEWVHHLQPLAMPSTTFDLTSNEAIAYPAIELFIDRANARSESFVLRDEDIGSVIEICRRLDGIPLALELAAGRIDVFGVRGLAVALDSLFAVLTKGRRTALPRHQTLHATLDWSFNLLGPRDRILLQRLAVFPGAFTLGSATAVAAWGELSASDVVEGISDLVTQSLLSADVSRDETLFRLLETTRAYAREKLSADSNASQTARRHAKHCLELLSEAEATHSDNRAADWKEKYGGLIDDLRASLTWAFSPRGDAAFGVTLTVAAIPLWFQMSLINECRERVEQALSMLRLGELRSDSVGMKLHAARGWSLMDTAGPARETGAAWTLAYNLAERQGNTDYRLRALWGMWAGKMNNAEFVAARELADRFCALAPQSMDPADRAIGDRMLGASLHFLGDQPGARLHIERMLSNYAGRSRRSHVVRYQFDPRVTAKITLSRVLWLQGHADQALSTVDASVEEALSIDHALSLCNTIAQSACPVALLAGDLERAERFTDILLRETERRGLDIWHIYANGYRGQILIKRGDVEKGLPLVQAAVDALRRARFVQYYTAFLLTLVEALAFAGRAPEALATVDKALEQSERTSERWAKPEMLRLRGEIALLAHGVSDAATAERDLAESMELARQQQALSWQLRTATSLARMRWDHSGPAAARELLAPVYGQFSEGFETADLKAARQLLEELSESDRRAR